MATIDIKLKSYDELIFEITKLNTDKYLLEKENKQLKENYERIYNENCKLRENHNINDISLLDENNKLKEELNKYKFPSCKAKDIEVVRANLVDMMRKNKRLEQENEQLKEDKKKARDKLYCYGEAFDGKILQQFQKEMLEILGDKE